MKEAREIRVEFERTKRKLDGVAIGDADSLTELVTKLRTLAWVLGDEK